MQSPSDKKKYFGCQNIVVEDLLFTCFKSVTVDTRVCSAGITPRKSFIINSLWCYNWACRAGTGGMFLTLITSKDYLAGWACRYQRILIGYAKFCFNFENSFLIHYTILQLLHFLQKPCPGMRFIQICQCDTAFLYFTIK